MTDRKMPTEELALLLMCRPDTISETDLCAISATEWSRILDWATEHRFAPYLHYNLSQVALAERLPENVAADLAGAYRRATIRALAMQRDMIQTSSILELAGIPHLFMKGAYLARFAYPELGLRPLRDLDVLVPRSAGMDAFNALLDSGLERKAMQQGNPEAHLDERKHLPPLRYRNGATVEVHTMTTAPSRFLRIDREQGSYENLARRLVRRDVAGKSICFEGPEDLVLHLCVHAAIDHQFNNGPLILSDVGWLLEKHEIDWDLLWKLAVDQGAMRGLALVLRLVEREWPAIDIDWGDSHSKLLAPDEPIITVASRSLLRSFALRGDVALQAELDGQQSLGAKFGSLFRRTFPRRVDLAREVPVAANSPWIFAYYPVKWWRLRRRLSNFIRSSFDPRARSDAERVGELSNWLQG